MAYVLEKGRVSAYLCRSATLRCMVKISKATLEEISLIQSIAQETWPNTFGNILSTEQIKYMLSRMYAADTLTRQIQEENHTFFLAWDDQGKATGFASIEPLPGSGTIKIHKLYILPIAQRRGVGCALLGAVEKQALEQNANAVTLNVNRYNIKAIAFYRRMGFEVVGEEIIPIGEGYLMEDYILTKQL